MKPTIQQPILNHDTLKQLAAAEGPCLSVFVPDHHPGSPEGAHKVQLEAMIKEASAQAALSQLDDVATALVKSAQELAKEPDFNKGGTGFAIFRAPGFEAQYHVPVHAAQAVLASHCYLTPLLAEANRVPEMLILGLSTKQLRLFEYRGGECRQIEIPVGVPESLELAGQFNRSDAQLSNREGAGIAGHGGGVHFGTASDHDRGPAYLHDFFEMVDRGLQPSLAGRPLLLLGVQEEMAAYRCAAVNPAAILGGQPGNVDYQSVTQIAERARRAALEVYDAQAERVLEHFTELQDRSHTATEIFAVLQAAVEGRVHQLCVRKSTPILGKLPAAIDRAFLPSEDLVNAAVVETLRKGGEVFVAPPDRMTEEQPLAAILRY